MLAIIVSFIIILNVIFNLKVRFVKAPHPQFHRNLDLPLDIRNEQAPWTLPQAGVNLKRISENYFFICCQIYVGKKISSPFQEIL